VELEHLVVATHVDCQAIWLVLAQTQSVALAQFQVLVADLALLVVASAVALLLVVVLLVDRVQPLVTNVEAPTTLPVIVRLKL
jgi:hypothetical protein